MAIPFSKATESAPCTNALFPSALELDPPTWDDAADIAWFE